MDEDTLGLYPTPSETGKTVRIVYLPKPTAMDSSSMAVEPDLYYRWHNLLVYATIREIALSGSNPDTIVANNYASMYNQILLEAKNNRDARNSAKYGQTTDVMPQWNGYRRRTYRRGRRYVR